MCADISMCMNKSCPSRKKCYRFMAKPNEHRQSYMNYTLAEEETKCNNFYQIDRSLPLNKSKDE